MTLRVVHRLCTLLIFTILAMAAPGGLAQSIHDQSVDKNAILILPFENSSSAVEFNWVGESFSDALSELLSFPGQIVISSDERELVYQQIGFPRTTLPSLASAIKLGHETKANMIVIGTYQVMTPPGGVGTNPNPAPDLTTSGQSTAQDDKTEDVTTQPIIRVSAKVLKVYEGRYEGNPITLSAPLSDLQLLHGKLAYELLYAYDKTLPYSQNQIVAQARKVPQRAFESYVKGLVTADPETRLAYLTNAVREYAKENPGQTYAQATFELAHIFFDQKDWARAAAYFSRITKRDPHYTEAAFYAALAFVRSGDYAQALTSLLPLTSTTPLTAIYNNAGAISIMAARAENNPQEKARLIDQGSALLARAAQSTTPDDLSTRFNFAYALFVAGKYLEAAAEFESLVKLNPRDGEAQFLLAKSLEKAGKADRAATADNDARRYLVSYAQWQTAWAASQSVNGVSLRLQQEFNRAPYYKQLRQEGNFTSIGDADSGSDELLVKARELYKAGRDDEALPELRNVLIKEPMNAEAYLLIGRINQRRGELDASINALKTAVFWDSKLVDAHILLGRIFLTKNDRINAKVYADNALRIAPNNPEALALSRQLTSVP